MDTNEITIPMGLSLMLYELVNALLYKEVKKEDGTSSVVERDLPFRLKYSLVRNLTPLKRDKQSFEDRKMIAMARYGTPNKEATAVSLVDQDAYDKYSKEMTAILDTPITHIVRKLEPDDLDKIVDTIDVSVEAMQLLSGYLTNDPKLLEDIYKPIDFNLPNLNDIKKEEEVKKPTNTTKSASRKTTKKTTTSTAKTTTKTTGMASDNKTTVKKTTTKKPVTTKKATTITKAKADTSKKEIKNN